MLENGRGAVQEGLLALSERPRLTSHYRGAKSLGHGEGYVYPHDHLDGWVPQQHRPAEVEGNVYYEPSRHGDEAGLTERWPARPSKNQSTHDKPN